LKRIQTLKLLNYNLGGAPRFAGHEIRRRRKSEGGQKFLPPNPLPFCPPELKSFSKFSVWIFAKKSSDFVQRSEPKKIAKAVVF